MLLFRDKPDLGASSRFLRTAGILLPRAQSVQWMASTDDSRDGDKARNDSIIELGSGRSPGQHTGCRLKFHISESTLERKMRKRLISRRTAMTRVGQMFAGIAIVSVGTMPAFGKAKAAKEDFFFQEQPGDDGNKCTGCINFSAKSAGLYGADSGDCALLEGDVCTHCYCGGWTDKNKAGAKKANT